MRAGIRKGLIAVICSLCSVCRPKRYVYGVLWNSGPSAAAMPGMLTKDGRLVPYEVNGPASAFVFSTTIEQHLGDINYFKVVSGTVKEGMI